MVYFNSFFVINNCLYGGCRVDVLLCCLKIDVYEIIKQIVIYGLENDVYIVNFSFKIDVLKEKK